LGGILTHVPDAAAGFSSTAILPTLNEACAQAGWSSDRAKLLRLGENAIYKLAADPVVVRIARSADRLPRVRRELCVARWLAASNVPAVRVRDDIDQPIIVNEHPVTFWHTVTGGGPVPNHIDLARLLAAFHKALDCPCELASFDPLGPSYSRLVKARTVTQDDRDFLKARCDHLNDELQHLEFGLPQGPIHGDAHTSNLLTDHGQVVLIDFENAAIGPREWDLLPTAIGVERYGRPEQQYGEFADTYGFDVRAWPGYPVLREVRELTMTTWIMQNIGESPDVAAEFALRVSCLRERDFTRAWHFF
jgi:Ser/Thr protein kinase RdoA (MazF antagonist)